jgi:anaphase-promoting complex subunit 6
VVAEAQNKVERVYGLGNSVDVMQSRVETLLAQSKFEDCLAMCKRYGNNLAVRIDVILA